jgi:DNA polymerase-3 subunit alpha
LFSEIDGALASAASSHRDKASGQSALFDMMEASPKAAKKVGSTVQPWNASEKLSFEKELLGFYVTGHPLDEYRPALEHFIPIGKLREQEDKSTVTVAGALISVEKKFTKKDSKQFAILLLEDLTEQIEVLVWSDTFNKVQAHLVQGNIVQITGKLDLREEGARLSANDVKPIKKPESREKSLVLMLNRRSVTESDLVAIREVIWSHPGHRRVELCFAGEKRGPVYLIPGESFKIEWTPETESLLAPWLPKAKS